MLIISIENHPFADGFGNFFFCRANFQYISHSSNFGNIIFKWQIKANKCDQEVLILFSVYMYMDVVVGVSALSIDFEYSLKIYCLIDQ